MGTKGVLNTKTWLKQVAYISNEMMDCCNPPEEIQVYRSKFDHSYITQVGMEKSIRTLVIRGITEQLSHGVGFSPKENKWYGWSHRAIYGFTIGSTCVKGDCHYKPRTVIELISNLKDFWTDSSHLNVTVSRLSPNKLEVSWTYDNTIPNKKIRGTISSLIHIIRPKDFGKGEWTALTMDDAKQMAIDFNRGVS
jgi:hypothetical protein